MDGDQAWPCGIFCFSGEVCLPPLEYEQSFNLPCYKLLYGKEGPYGKISLDMARFP
jgi:hypothetical protein